MLLIPVNSGEFTESQTVYVRKCPRCDKEFRTNNVSQNYCSPQHSRNGPSAMKTPMKFCAIDGEGITLPNGEHRYVLLGIGQYQKENESGLTFDEILTALYSQYKSGIAYVGFFLGYDFNQWFKTLPESRARMLLTEEGRISRTRKKIEAQRLGPFPVKYDPKRYVEPEPVRYGKWEFEWEWEFDILGMKRFKFRKRLCEHLKKCDCKQGPYMYICDAGPFFQMSLISVLAPKNWSIKECENCDKNYACPNHWIVTQEEYDSIVLNKARRDSAKLDDQMRYYNRLENDILERVMRKLDEGFRNPKMQIHLTPKQWMGPGQAAQNWMQGRAPYSKSQIDKKTGEIKRIGIEDVVEKDFLIAAKNSYIGGWFEVFVHGIIPGETYEYDINSAYPYIISKLPCLFHGKYQQGIGEMPTIMPGEYCLVKAEVWTRPQPNNTIDRVYIGAMLHRNNKGHILRPEWTKGWYWWHELKAAEKAGCIAKINPNQIDEWCIYTPCDCPSPMREVVDLYQLRLEAEKSSSLGKAAKLCYNSMYGKFAQSIGHPMFANPIYASLITSGCRTQILNAIATHPEGKSAVAMVATDGIYFLSPHTKIDSEIEKFIKQNPDKKNDDRLGYWEKDTRNNLTIFKPGVYWDDTTRRNIEEGEIATFKARGINAKDFSKELTKIDNWFKSWDGIVPEIGRIFTRNNREIWMPVIGWPNVEVPLSFSTVTCPQALQRNKWNTAGIVLKGQKADQSSNPADKRFFAYYDEERGIYRSEPHPKCPNGNVESTAYSKKFGMDDLDNPFSETSRSKYGYTPDGYAGDEYLPLLAGRD